MPLILLLIVKRHLLILEVLNHLRMVFTCLAKYWHIIVKQVVCLKSINMRWWFLIHLIGLQLKFTEDLNLKDMFIGFFIYYLL
jgi:hypothetical protein